MSQNDNKLSELIDILEKNANPNNMEKIYNELKSLSNDEQKLIKNIPQACKLISLIGTFLVKGEGLNTMESQLIFDIFCDLDFMSLLVKYSSFDIYEINLEIINTFSFLMINIKTTHYLYYFFSKNLLNKIISKDFSKYDEEFLSYYVNFLKSLSLRLDEVSVQLFYDEKTNNFPIIENVVKLYNHRDSMIRNVVRNVVLNILKIKSPNIQDHFIELPSISYLANVACHLRDICLQINDEVAKHKLSSLHYLYDDLIDEATYIDDLLNLNLEKINYVIINCLFYYLIIPIICGSISEKTNRISKNVALFLLVFFFVNMKNEIFKNCLFSLIFFDKISSDLDLFFVIPPEKNNYSFYADTKKDITFCQFISENYSSKFLLTIIKPDNIIYNEYKNKYPQIGEIMNKCKGMYQKFLMSGNKASFFDIKDTLETIINSFFSEEESNNMSQYHRNLIMSTGLSVGQFSKETSGEIYNICFLCYMNQIFVDLKGEENSSLSNYTINIIKEGLNKIVEDMDENTEEMILLVNMLIFVVQNKETNISNNLLRHVELENIKEKILVKDSKMKNNANYIGDKKSKNESPLSELCLNNNNFNFTNDYFSLTKDPKNKLLNTIILPLLLSQHLLIKNKKVNNDNKENEENPEIISKNIFLLPLTYQLIYLNIVNISINSSNIFELKKEKNPFNTLVNNVQNIYSQVLEIINDLLKQNEKYREEGYNIFYKKWKIYNKKINNKNTIELIRDEIMNTAFLLLPDDYEKSEEDCPDEISRNHASIKNNYFGNSLLLFMMLHDLREILLNKTNSAKNIKIIKDNFPLIINKDDIIEFKVNTECNLDKIRKKKIYKQSVKYKINNNEEFEEGEFTILYGKCLYIVKSIKQNLVKIICKIPLKLAKINQDSNETDIINIMVENYTENIGDDSFEEKEDDEKTNLNIIVKFNDDKIRDNTLQYINDKIFTLNNDERLAFNQFIKEMNNDIKDSEQDF